ncbi:MAG TPA: hypothetical protein VGN61_13295 [Verrucomicrobiae bacterium]|jgi:hypothetical protein|nr:hypothetical protein [Verrucomicrobiae bacterium]
MSQIFHITPPKEIRGFFWPGTAPGQSIRFSPGRIPAAGVREINTNSAGIEQKDIIL